LLLCLVRASNCVYTRSGKAINRRRIHIRRGMSSALPLSPRFPTRARMAHYNAPRHPLDPGPFYGSFASHASSSLLLQTLAMSVPGSRLASALSITGRQYPALRAGPSCRAAFRCEQARNFAISPRWHLRTKEMNDDHLKDLKVNQGRLMEDIHHTCQWGIGERWGE
jgi:hypothetical protein